MPGLPTGTVTFLFTDIEGSTRLLQQLGNLYEDVLAEYRRLLRSVFQENGGREVDTQGDSFFIAFARARDALVASVTAQRSIVNSQWPRDVSVRVRMGLHTGEPLRMETGYTGMDVHRAARICGAGHGGQILLSETTSALIAEDLPRELTLRDLGKHNLKDLAYPQHLFQVVAPDLPADFPPLKSVDLLPNNLPRYLTSFVGRERELQEIKTSLSAVRLLTLTGTGGAGKTRLAVHVAAEVLEEFPDGAWIIELAALADPELVSQAVAIALHLTEQPKQPWRQTLVEHLRSKTLLLLLDNCEHLLSASAQLADALLRECPGLRILATSREGLGITGELTCTVPSLKLPDIAHLPPVEQLPQYEAVRLFIERALFSRPGFQLTRNNAQAVAQICYRLDGIPLAIELAAARVKTMPVETIAVRLDDRFRLLTGGSRTALPRHQTLRAALDWSYALLTEAERVLFCRVVAFTGGFTLDAAENVCTNDPNDDDNVLELLTRLVDKSLVIFDEHDSQGRYRLLETVRQYGLARLLELGEADLIRKRHRDFFLALAERAEKELTGTDQGVWLDRLEREHDNIRAVFDSSLVDVELGMRLASALWRFWMVRGYVGEGRARFATLLGRATGTEPAVVRAKTLTGAGILAWQQGDYAAARALNEEGLTILRELGEKSSIADALNNLGRVATAQGDYTAARGLYEETLAIRRELKDTVGIAPVLNNLGVIALEQGDYVAALGLYEESLAIKRGLGDKLGIAFALNNLGLVATAQSAYTLARSYYEESLAIAREVKDKGGIISYTLNNLGDVAFHQGEYGSAQVLYKESLAIKEELGDKLGIAYSLNNLGDVAFHQLDYAEAQSLYEESLSIRKTLGDKLGIAECLEGLAGLAGVQGQSERAARLFGAAEALRKTVGAPLSPADRTEYERKVSFARAGHDEAAFSTAWTQGQEMTLEQAVEHALIGKIA